MALGSFAQEKPITGTKINLVLPDGKLIGFDKLDSVKKAWGTDQVLFSHNDEDDRKGIMHLIRKTEQFVNEETASLKAHLAMLNKPAPDLALEDIEGRSVSLAALKGKVVVLNFWFIGCAPCVAEMPELNKLAGHYDRDKVIFLALGTDKADNIRSFLKQHAFKYQMLPNAAGVAKDYKVNNYPTSIVIDQDGVIRLIIGSDVRIGEVLAGEIDKLIRPLP